MTSWISSGSMRRLAASLLVAGCAALAAPVHAFSVTRNVDGGYEYYFSASSLRIESAGDLDLSGLSFIEGVVDGFRVGASFALDWLGGESAQLESQAASWDGSSSEPRSLEILAGGSLSFGTVSLTLIGGNILLAAGSDLVLGTGSFFDVGADPLGPPRQVILPERGQIILAIPEPSNWAILVAGLLALATAVRKRSIP